MTDLQAAIAEVRFVTPTEGKDSLWLGDDFCDEGQEPLEIENAIACILNAVLSGDLIPRSDTRTSDLLEVLEWVESTGMCEHGGGGEMIRKAIAKTKGE